MFYNPVRSMRDNRYTRYGEEPGMYDQNEEIECRGNWIPTVDVKETSEKLVLYAEVPGLRKNEVNVSVRENILSLSGEKMQTEAAKDENVHRSERVYGKFCRRFVLPSQVDVTKIQAELVNGVLKVTLPKQEQAKAQEIKIK